MRKFKNQNRKGWRRNLGKVYYPKDWKVFKNEKRGGGESF